MRTISVIPNPYIALDKDGVPQGTVGAGMPGVFIGASIDLVASRKTGKTRFYYPKNGDGSLTRKVILSSDIVTAVLAGELLAATIEDARVCGVSDEEYLAPEKVLASEREKALAYWRSLKGASAEIGEIPREETPEKEGEETPALKAAEEVTPGVKMTKPGGSKKAEA
jgi:hypothetical protein